RVLEKFEIERVYCERRGISWGIVTEEEIDKTVARNIRYINDYFDIRNYEVYRETADQQIKHVSLSPTIRLLINSKSTRIIASEFDADTHLPFGSGVTLFYHLLAKKIMVTDMYKPIDLEKPTDVKYVDESKLEKVKYG